MSDTSLDNAATSIPAKNSSQMSNNNLFAKDQPLKVGIVGGGVAGSTIAIRLAALGVQTYLLEAKDSLIDGPPMCHLHAGGNLYREIPDEDCVELLIQSIDMVRMYPFSIDVRPTVIAIPTRDKGDPSDLLPRLKLLTNEYRKLINADPDNKVLGEPEDYYKLYDRKDLEKLKAEYHQTKQNQHSTEHVNSIPKSTDEWVAAAAHQLDLDKLKFPIVSVNEYGWNIFRLAASAHMALSDYPNATLLMDSKVTSVTQLAHDCSPCCPRWQINYFTTKTEQTPVGAITLASNSRTEQQQSITVDYLINACGFRTGEIDNMVGVPATRMVEFKASYIANWETNNQSVNQSNHSTSSDMPLRIPEIIIHGERGTPQGMVQLTPYPDSFYQIHSMAKDVTLFDDGLVSTEAGDAQPKLKPTYINYIEEGWNPNTLNERSQRAITQVSEFVPKFATASPINNALYGGQQIPGRNDTLRVADVSLYADICYARAENVKATSALLAADYICDALKDKNLIEHNEALEQQRQQHQWPYLQYTTKAEMDEFSKLLALDRKFPIAMAGVVQPLFSAS